MSPFFANHGYHPRMSITVEDSTVPDAEERLCCLREAHRSAEASIKHALEAHILWANKKRIAAPDYKVGDKVWLMRRFISTARPSSKLDFKKLGPFVILERIGQRAFRLELPGTMRIHPVFHVSLLEKYIANRHPQRDAPPPPDPVIVDDVQRYFVERILDSRLTRGRLDYFVHWQGYPIEDRTWMWASDLPDDDSLVIQFHTDHPDKTGYSRIRPHRTRRARA